MKEHNIMKIKLFLLAAFGAVLSLSGCRPEQDGPSEDRTVYREVAVSLGQADEEPGTRSLVSIDIEHFQKLKAEGIVFSVQIYCDVVYGER